MDVLKMIGDVAWSLTPVAWIALVSCALYLTLKLRLDIKTNREMIDELQARSTEGIHEIPEEVLAAAHMQMISHIGMDLDLCERIHTDLVFLHSQVCKTKCPTCDSTIPELESFLHKLRSMKVHVADGGSGPPPMPPTQTIGGNC